MKPIYVVDDNLDTLLIVDSILSEEGYEVKCFSDWQNLFSELNYSNPCLIIMDVYLGPADGRYIADQLKTGTNTKNIPIILFSSDLQASKGRVNEFLPKPFTASALLSNVKKIVGAPKN